jgi:multidrug resistance efflux pump
MHSQLAAKRDELERERLLRRRAEQELARAEEARRRYSAELAAAGWRVEHERRTRAEAELDRLQTLSGRLEAALETELEHLQTLVTRWRAGEEPAAGSRPGTAPPAGLLLARALELATGEVEPAEATRELVALADGDGGALEEAIARAERIMWEPTASAEGVGSIDPESSTELAGQLPVLVAGAASLLSAALHRLRAG